jgi:hypothetical protein
VCHWEAMMMTVLVAAAAKYGKQQKKDRGWGHSTN